MADTRVLGLVRAINIAKCVLAAAVVVAVGVALLSAATAFALPEGRHYEMVSPPYKGGYGVFRLTAVAVSGAGEGERVVFSSLGTFAGVPNNTLASDYLARRGPGGWSTVPLVAPASIESGSLSGLSPGLESAVFFGSPGPSSGAAEEETLEPEFLWHDLDTPDTAPNAPQPGPNFTLAGMPLKRLDGKRARASQGGESPELCHVLFRKGPSIELERFLPEATGTEGDLYDMTTGVPGCSGEPGIRLVGVGNTNGPHGEPAPISKYCHTYLGGENGNGEGNSFDAVSVDGSEIFFTSNTGKVSSVNECDGVFSYPANPAVSYVRLNGERTVQVSEPLAVDCQSGPCKTAVQQRAEFVGASETGSRVFFTTTQPLVTGDTDTGKDLYMASIGCPAGEPSCEPSQREVLSMIQVSHDPNVGEAAEVQKVVRVAPDGGRVYFVAHGVLSEEGPVGEGSQSKPLKGANNLYVYDAEEGSGTVRFIADLCSGPERSGEASDLRCPSTLGSGEVNNDSELVAQTAGPDGSYLVFTSWSQLVADDTDTTKDVYRYDAVTGQLGRVSVGEDGYSSNGNSNVFSAQLDAGGIGGFTSVMRDHEMGSRAVSEDGSRIVFETDQRLSPDATNGLLNAYEWHEGHVGLVSDGSDEEPVKEVVMAPSGRDLLFVTVAGLVRQDTDGARDVYDARLGEGFPESPASEQSCSGDACQGPLTNPAPLLVPGSVSQAAGENVPIKSRAKAKPKKRSKPKTKKRRHRARRARRASHLTGREIGRKGR
jgi:hypothetical protein